jgi:hypothetical protein
VADATRAARVDFPEWLELTIALRALFRPAGFVCKEADMVWYSMRAVVEYLQPNGPLTQVSAVAERDASTGAAIRAGGLVAFSDGSYSTFDGGCTAGTVAMDLRLLGTKAVIEMDDFVLDWTNSFAFKNLDIPTGFAYKTGAATRKDVEFVTTAAERGQDVAMIERFVELATGNPGDRLAYGQARSLPSGI